MSTKSKVAFSKLVEILSDSELCPASFALDDGELPRSNDLRVIIGWFGVDPAQPLCPFDLLELRRWLSFDHGDEASTDDIRQAITLVAIDGFAADEARLGLNFDEH